MHAKIEEKYLGNKSFLDENDRAIIEKIELYVQALIKRISPVQLKTLFELENLYYHKQSLHSQQKKIQSRINIIDGLYSNKSFEPCEITPFKELNDDYDYDSGYTLSDILDLNAEFTKDDLQLSLNKYIIDNQKQVSINVDKLDKIEQDIKLLSKDISTPDFDVVNEYFKFKNDNGYTFYIGSDGQLQKISRKGIAGPKFSVVYANSVDPHQGQTEHKVKNILYSGKARALGRGGYGKVKLAQKYDDAQQVDAVKTQPKSIKERSTESMINIEMANLKTMGMLHGHVDMDKKNKHYIFMTLFSGAEVFEAFGKDPENTQKTMTMLLAAAKALQKLHDSNKVHRDVKLENFIFNEELNVCNLIDFSFLVNDVDGNKMISCPDFMGTKGFLAPELIEAHEIQTNMPNNKKVNENVKTQQYPYSKRSDIYAFGAILKQLESFIPIEFATDADDLMKTFSERQLNLDSFIEHATKYLSVIADKDQISLSVKRARHITL